MITAVARTMPNKISKIKGHSRPKKLDTLEIGDLHANIGELKILNGINLTIRSGEIHAIMGPNGSGKSTLCNVLMGHPKYTVTKGSAKFNGKEILDLEPNERANLGLFLGFQHPMEIAGVSFGNFLRLSKNANLTHDTEPDKDDQLSKSGQSFKNNESIKSASISPLDFMKIMKEKVGLLKMDEKFITRSVNEGFSGGEKKRAEIVQMAVLEPKIALLDEIDSGLDIDALKIVARGILETFKKTHSGILLITHYQRLLNYITPDFVHVMDKGKIIRSGDKKLARELEKNGYHRALAL